MDAIEGLFSSVNSITFFVQSGNLARTDVLTTHCDPLGLCGMGAEVLIDLPSPQGSELELGLSTSFLRGFTAAESSLDLRGALRILPLVSVYATKRDLLGWDGLNPYVGVNAGLSTLWNAQAYDADGRPYALAGEAFEYGLTAGAFINLPPARGLFVEGSYRVRRYPSLMWTLPEGETVLPPGWPPALDVSGWLLTAGWQFKLRDG